MDNVDQSMPHDAKCRTDEPIWLHRRASNTVCNFLHLPQISSNLLTCKVFLFLCLWHFRNISDKQLKRANARVPNNICIYIYICYIYIYSSTYQGARLWLVASATRVHCRIASILRNSHRGCGAFVMCTATACCLCTHVYYGIVRCPCWSCCNKAGRSRVRPNDIPVPCTRTVKRDVPSRSVHTYIYIYVCYSSYETYIYDYNLISSDSISSKLLAIFIIGREGLSHCHFDTIHWK